MIKSLPKWQLPQISNNVRLFIGLAMLISLLSSAAITLCDFPFNGNPIAWIRAKEMVVTGLRLESQFHLEQSLRYFQQAANIYPKDAHFQFALGECCQRLRRYPEAQKAFEAATKLNTQFVGAWLHLGEVLSVEHHEKESEAATRRAVSIEPLNPDAQMQLALLLRLNGKIEEAQKIFESTRSLERDTARYWYLSGRYYHDEGKPQETEAAFRQAAELNKTEPEYAEWLGLSLYSHHKVDDALEYLARAAHIAPENSTYWDNLGAVFLSQHNLAESEKCYEKAIALDPHNLKFMKRYGVILYREKKWSQAEPVLAKLLASDKNDSDAWDYYLHCLLREKKFVLAEKVLREFLAEEKHSNIPQAWTFLADVLRQEKQGDQAAEAYKHALALKPDDQLKLYLEKRLANADDDTPAGNNLSEPKSERSTK